jgi:pimeloyl-ACP methyl ester carboxylesterase
MRRAYASGVEVRLTPARAVGRTEVDRGRSLAWSAWGPADGRTVLFFSGAAMASSLGFGADVVDELGVHLIALDRPGIGGSDPHPGRTMRSWADDVRAFVHARRLEPVHIVGYSMGAPYALACAAFGVTKSVAVVAGQDDVSHAPTGALLDPEFAALVAAVAEDPRGVEHAFATTASAEMLMELVARGSSPHDLSVYASDEFASAYRAAVEDGFRGGASGYARDFVLAVQPWPFAVESITARVDLWYGALDASAVHSPDRGEILARRIPRSRRHLVADAGGSLLWTHAEPILQALLDGDADARPADAPTP